MDFRARDKTCFIISRSFIRYEASHSTLFPFLLSFGLIQSEKENAASFIPDTFPPCLGHLTFPFSSSDRTHRPWWKDLSLIAQARENVRRGSSTHASSSYASIPPFCSSSSSSFYSLEQLQPGAESFLPISLSYTSQFHIRPVKALGSHELSSLFFLIPNLKLFPSVQGALNFLLAAFMAMLIFLVIGII